MNNGKAAPDAGTSEAAKREDLRGPFRFHDNRKWRFLQMHTYIAAMAFGFALGAIITAIGMTADRKGGGKA